MRWLGVDPGGERVGIAACDPDERIAVPVEVVPASAAFPAIRSIAAREEVGGIVIGLPLLMDGREGSAAAAARRLGERVRTRIGIPVEYQDERLSTVEAEHAAQQGAARRRPSDDMAAAIILQRFLDERRDGGASGAAQASSGAGEDDADHA